MSAPEAVTLRAARKMIEKPGSWTQGVAARNKHGHEVRSSSHSAVSWCSIGAIWSHDPGDCTYSNVEAFLRLAIGCEEIVEWNDAPGRTHAEVLDAFDRAIALAEAHK